MGIIDNIKDVVNIVKKFDDIELYRKILNLQSEINELNDENNQLKATIDKLEKEKNVKGSMVFKEPYYFQEGDSVPFCSRCWEGDNQTIHLIEAINKGMKKCPQCKSVFGDDRPTTQQITFSR